MAVGPWQVTVVAGVGCDGARAGRFGLLAGRLQPMNGYVWSGFFVLASRASMRCGCAAGAIFSGTGSDTPSRTNRVWQLRHRWGGRGNTRGSARVEARLARSIVMIVFTSAEKGSIGETPRQEKPDV